MTKLTSVSRIEGLFFGKVEERWSGRPPSAIAKTAAQGSRRIEALGFIDDAQADLENHGGLDKAIHHYPTDHYAAWMSEDQIPRGTTPAHFGENIAGFGMTEETLCIGDTLRLGSAIVQISQGRQPCWKVAEHTGNPRMAYQFQKTGRTGWYYRVLEPGQAETGDTIELLERPHPDWSVKVVTSARLTRRISAKDADTLAALPELAEGWRQAFGRIAGGQTKEDTSQRLQG